MPIYPTPEQVIAYLGGDSSWTIGQVTEALAAETANQAKVCRIPADPESPAEPLPLADDLAEALKRRVAHNLALRALPLGVQATLSEAAVAQTRVGGLDAEVRRFERPWRKRSVG